MARFDQKMLMKLAGAGAAARIQELEAEIAAIRAAFPTVGGGRSGKKATTSAPRKRGKLSAAGRKAIVAAQRARWAKIKAAKAGK